MFSSSFCLKHGGLAFLAFGIPDNLDILWQAELKDPESSVASKFTKTRCQHLRKNSQNSKQRGFSLLVHRGRALIGQGQKVVGGLQARCPVCWSTAQLRSTEMATMDWSASMEPPGTRAQLIWCICLAVTGLCAWQAPCHARDVRCLNC